ncbi:TAXI family TRAP transporter solute-binding subunit [Desulfoluna sp.]|uniref:TAXI family TRAP transporter solute-binding subunit n=1 Tax=Desulfoluna sp. TaxID=2045199 RepID=UPI00261E0C5A|nr:TAXI family TRAP transporter solute-binding subunit [Desulfoluna sp.]
MKRMLIAFLGFFLIALGGRLAGASDQHMRFMAGPPGGNWFAMGGAFADLWTQDVVPVTSGTGGGLSNVINVSRGKGDLGLTVASVLGAAQKGEGPFKHKMADAQNFANLYRQYTYFVARKGFVEKYGIKTLGDIIRKKVPVRLCTLKPGTSSEFVIRSIFEKGFDADWKDIKRNGGSVQFATYSGGANLIADGHIDLFAFAVGRAASIVMKIESQTEVVILPVDEVARTSMARAYGTTTFEVDQDLYQSVTGPVPVVGDYTCIVIRRSVAEETAYNLAKSLYAHRESLASVVKDLGEMRADEAVSPGIVTHPGAETFWREASR